MIVHGELHDLLMSASGARVATFDEWVVRRSEWLAQVVDLVYGGLPPRPDRVQVRVRSKARVRRLPGEPSLTVYGVRADLGGGHVDIGLQLLAPRRAQRLPVVIDPDACWWNLDDASVVAFLNAGVVLARFDRTEVVPDLDATVPVVGERVGGLYDLVPDHGFGALAAWAWGVHTVVDALSILATSRTLPVDDYLIDPDRLAITGFSRGGKAALLAGATDPRIGLVHAHASGAGGAAPFLLENVGSEGMRVVERFPGWFGPRLTEFVGREAELPVDQHALLAAVAPRPLLLTCGSEDLWANPAGTEQAARAAGTVSRLLGRPGATEFRLRPGGHHHGPEDWSTLLAFVGEHWFAR